MKNKHYVNSIILLCAAVYFISYVTRINYSSIILNIIKEKGITETAASAALTGSFITYGVGQLISGYMGDKIKPITLVFCGLLVTSAMNILMPLAPTVPAMTAIWCVNGFSQAFMWPPLVKYLTNLLSLEDYNKACVRVSWGAYVGTIVVYLLSPLCISVLNWRFVFFISAFLGIAMAFIWFFFSAYLEKRGKKLASDKVMRPGVGATHKLNVSFGLITMIGLTMLAIILQGILRDGITTWMPSFISETYHLSDSISILTNVAMPIMSICVSQFVLWLYSRKIKNEQTCSGVMFAIGSVCSLLLFLLCGKSAPLSVAFGAIITACMHGANLMLISILSGKFGKYGNVSFMSGLLNSCTYIGAAISGYGMALMSKYFGWNGTILSWVLIAAVGGAICFALIKPWSNFLKK